MIIKQNDPNALEKLRENVGKEVEGGGIRMSVTNFTELPYEMMEIFAAGKRLYAEYRYSHNKERFEFTWFPFEDIEILN